MAFVPATNVIQAELIYSWDGQIVENVLHYQWPGGATVAQMAALGDALIAVWNTNLKDLVTPTVSLTEVRLTDLTTQFAPGVTRTTGLPIVGTGTGVSLPNNVSLAVTKRTAFRGRAYRGRIYQVGLGESQVTANVVHSTTLANILLAWNEFLTLNVSGTFVPLVVVSKWLANTQRAAAVVTPVESFSSDGIIDSQRRRLPRRGS